MTTQIRLKSLASTTQVRQILFQRETRSSVSNSKMTNSSSKNINLQSYKSIKTRSTFSRWIHSRSSLLSVVKVRRSQRKRPAWIWRKQKRRNPRGTGERRIPLEQIRRLKSEASKILWRWRSLTRIARLCQSSWLILVKGKAWLKTSIIRRRRHCRFSVPR